MYISQKNKQNISLLLWRFERKKPINILVSLSDID